jgi:hypothetical protein
MQDIAKDDEGVSGLDLLRAPFKENQISKLPKPTRRQTDEVKADFKKGVRCEICGGWHHPNVVHLDYVGHAALTDRLLDCDINWNWEPTAFSETGSPAFDANGGMWIKLTVCGVTRLGYGSADGKSGGDAVKEIIGDALRNAAMRFGAALDLWHKGDLHVDEETPPKPPAKITPDQVAEIQDLAEQAKVDDAKILAFFNVENYAAITVDIFPRVIAKLEASAKAHDKAEESQLGDDAKFLEGK